MELRPFRSLRLSPRETTERGLSSWIARPDRAPHTAAAPTTDTAPEGARNVLPLTIPAAGPEAAELAAATLQRWLADGTLTKERRPALWIDRQSRDSAGRTFVIPVLVGLVRLGKAADDVELPAEEEGEPAERIEQRVALRRALKADFEPCLLLSKAPLAAALDTTRRPDLSVVDRDGVRHDAFRIIDFAQHVQLQGLVKNADVRLVAGRSLWDAAKAFDPDPAAVKLSGARFKLCGIADEELVERMGRELPAPAPPIVPAGFFGTALEDPVY